MKLKLIATKPETENVQSFIFEPQEPLQWQAGQYLHYILDHPNRDDRGVERWFTISAAPFEKNVMLTTRFATEKSSSFKQALLRLKPGDTVEADTPEGEFTYQGDAYHYVLIAGGIGITPYRSMLTQLDHDGKDIRADLLYLNRDENFVFNNELADLERRHPGFHVHKFTGDRRLGEDDLTPYTKNASALFYISGPRPMVEAYEHLLEKMGVPKERIKVDYFPGYVLG